MNSFRWWRVARIENQILLYPRTVKHVIHNSPTACLGRQCYWRLRSRFQKRYIGKIQQPSARQVLYMHQRISLSTFPAEVRRDCQRE